MVGIISIGQDLIPKMTNFWSQEQKFISRNRQEIAKFSQNCKNHPKSQKTNLYKATKKSSKKWIAKN